MNRTTEGLSVVPADRESGAIQHTGRGPTQAGAAAGGSFRRYASAVGWEKPETVLSVGVTGWWLLGLVTPLIALTVALTVGWRPVTAVDHSVATWAYHLTYGHPVRSSWWKAVAEAGSPMVLRVVLVLVAAFQAWRGRRALAAWLVGVVVAENLIAPFSKYLLNRPRPHWLHPIAVEHSSSFPSGHAAGAGMFVLAVVLLVRTTVRSSNRRWWAIGPATLVGMIVCADRMMLGVHYLSDVVGGLLVGAIVVLLGWLVMLKVQLLRDRRAVSR